VAGIVHSLTLLAILLFAAPVVSFVPMAVLAGILMVVAYKHGRVDGNPVIAQTHQKTDVSVLAGHICADRFSADLNRGCAGWYDSRSASLHQPCGRNHKQSLKSPTTTSKTARVHILQDKDIPYYATIFRIHGPFLFRARLTRSNVVTEKVHELPPVGCAALCGI